MPHPPADVGSVEPVPTQDPAELPWGTPRLAARHSYRNIFHQRRDEQVGDDQRQSQVNDNHPDEVHEVGFFLFRKQKDHHQCADSRGRGRKDGRESLPVFEMGVVVDHHDRGVDDYSERDRDSGKGVDVDLKTCQTVDHQGGQHIDRQSEDNDQHIPPRPVDQEHEHQQNQDAEGGTDIDFAEFLADILRGIVGDAGGDFRREAFLKLRHPFLDGGSDSQQVGRRSYLHRQSNGVQTVDTIVT